MGPFENLFIMVTLSKICTLFLVFVFFSFAFSLPIMNDESEARQAAATQAILGSLGTALVPVVGNLLVPVIANLASGLSSALAVGLQTTQQAGLLQRPILNRPLLNSPLLNRPLPTMISRPIEDSLDAFMVNIPGTQPMMLLSTQGNNQSVKILRQIFQQHAKTLEDPSN